MDERMLKWARITGASFLAVLGACAGRYDVGDAQNDGGAGAPEGGTGGSSVATGGTETGGTSTATGGTGDDGGTAGSTGGRGAGGSSVDGGTAGSTGGRGAGGSSTTGGTAGSTAGSPPLGGAGGTSGTGGTGGEPSSCGQPLEPTYGALETPFWVWERIQAVLNDVQPAAVPEGLPDETTPEWAADRMSDELSAARFESSTPRGVERFMRGWLAVSAVDESVLAEEGRQTAAAAARAFSAEGATFASLTMPDEGGTLYEDSALNRLRPGISQRGYWLVSKLLCVDVGAVPPDTSTAELPDAPTRREALTELVSSPACVGCHNFIDPPGFSLEGIDPVTGEPRTSDNGHPIDTSGSFRSPNNTGSYFVFSSIVDLAPQLAASCEVATCFVQQFASDAAAEAGLGAFTSEELSSMTFEYVESGYSFEALLRAMARTPTFLE
jgi:hypothetical protein